MVFSSTVFLFAFLPLFLAVYFAFRRISHKNVMLLVASLVFYAWGEPVYIVLMLISIVANWFFGLKVADGRQLGRGKALLVATIAFNVLVIGFFKYEGLLADSVNAMLGMQAIPNLELPLPIGISFYTLQALSYVIDSYRGTVKPQRNLLFLGMYIASFPQLIAGPIVRYQTIEPQIVERDVNLSDFTSGMRLFAVGLAKKTILANTCAVLADKIFSLGGGSVGMAGAWLGLLAYFFQIYFDFGGYSDMAIGLGRMMGFKYLRNFNYPYIARSIREFWHRWHISLGLFLRDYVYIPLGGSRCSTPRWMLNILIVWALCGLWHGAAWNFVLWGLYYGILLIGEKLLWGKALSKLPSFVQIVITDLLVLLGWALFRIGLGHLSGFGSAMFGLAGATGHSTLWELTIWAYWPVFIICLACALPLLPWLKERFLAWVEGRSPRSILEGACSADSHALDADGLCRLDAKPATEHHARACRVMLAVCNALSLALMLISAAAIATGGFNPFIYFQF